jgi:hypothetical protein
MKRHSMIVVAVMVLMAIYTTLLASDGDRRDVRDLGYQNANPNITASTNPVAVSENRRDARDLNFLNSSDIRGVSSKLIVVPGDRKDARDLAY